ncbi:MAG: hypothetical protein A4E44_00362 [Methanosaeta sp. PtaB.Bin018]|nr:MAG: hypothetical protein A4E44_00362 [Methanosaeta sp. PtaB.Bin018]
MVNDIGKPIIVAFARYAEDVPEEQVNQLAAKVYLFGFIPFTLYAINHSCGGIAFGQSCVAIESASSIALYCF